MINMSKKGVETVGYKHKFKIQSEDIKENYTTGEVAEMLHVQSRSVRRWISDGKLRAFTVGNNNRIPMSALKEFVQNSSGFEEESTEPVDILKDV